LRGLDWFTFFLADIQTGFGPFVAVYLTAQAWSQGDIGLILTVGGLVALAGQVPAGLIVDSARSTRAIAMAAVAAISVSALAIAGWPIFAVVLGARVLHAAASCLLGPTIAALSLGLVGHTGLGERLGRNARFASIGAGVAALAMGATGHFFTGQGVFVFTAILVVPALGALKAIKPTELVAKRTEKPGAPGVASGTGIRALLSNKTLLIFAAAIVTFHLANTAMLPLMSGIITKHSADTATIWVAACMIVPQIIVATASPFVGRMAESWGRHPLLLICFAALLLRGVVFALGSDPYLVVGAQALDGVSAAMLAVLFPLIIADVTIGTGKFNVALGLVGSAMGIGAALSPTMAGYAFDHFGGPIAFLGLAVIAAAGLLIVLFMMPETRPSRLRSQTLKFIPLSKSIKLAGAGSPLQCRNVDMSARTENSRFSPATDLRDLRS
jgi:MFS family permease